MPTPLVFFETLGCQMNVADSEMIKTLLAQQGYGTTDKADKADLVILNTCSVRDHAEARAKARITEFSAYKRTKKKQQAIWVVGCMAQRMGDALKHEFPAVDRVIGAMDLETLSLQIDEYLGHTLQTQPAELAPGAVSCFVPVMRGCDNYCSYCIVPYVRGREHSLPLSEVVDSVCKAVDSGVREVMLLGQNVNSYKDPGSGADFPALLEAIHAINGLARIRFTTSHPKDCSPRLISVMAGSSKICRHLHLPVQSGSSRILGLMNRRYTRDDYLKLVGDIRTAIPDIDLTTDIMTGFPTETEADFDDTISLVRQARFTTAFMFHYSPRPQTKAADMEGAVPPTTAKARLKELIDVQTAITKEHYHAMVGRMISVLFTEKQEKGDAHWMGQDNGCKRVLFACRDNLAGTILPVKVKSTTGMTLIAERTN